MTGGEIINRVSQSELVTFDFGDLFPEGEMSVLDISAMLYEGLLLREKEFREKIKEEDWSRYSGQHVALTCSTDAIIPSWAWMLLASSLQPYAATVIFGNSETLVSELLLRQIEALDAESFRDKKVTIKGCGDRQVPAPAWVALTMKLRPVVKSIMYGEPCSTVPVFKAR